MFRWNRSVWLSLLLSCGGSLHAEEPEVPPPPAERPMASSRPNLKTQTLGGVQFWGDVTYFHGWHIQKNVFTGHYRLLDANDVRHAWGTREACEAKLQQIRTEEKLPALSGTAVILLHGLGRSDKSMWRLKQHFEKAGYYTITMNYPSLRASVQENAEYLHQVLQSLEGIEKVHLIGFSMGGIVLRQCLATHPEPRLGRVVFIGSPNQGAELATLLKDWWAFKTFGGPGALDLATAPHGVASRLPAPAVEFGIIAGSRGVDGGYNPLIPGDDDGTVSVDSTRLPGATDTYVVRGLHQMLLHTPAVFAAAQSFLELGRFQADRDPDPIPRIDPMTDAEVSGKPASPSPEENSRRASESGNHGSPP